MQRHSSHFATLSTILRSVFFLVVLTCSMTVFGQTEKQQHIIACGPPVVRVRVELIGKAGSRIADKEISDFIVFEDGVKQTIEFFYVPVMTDPRGQRAVYYLGYTPRDDLNDRTREIEAVLVGGESNEMRGFFNPVSYNIKSIPGIREDERWKTSDSPRTTAAPKPDNH